MKWSIKGDTHKGRKELNEKEKKREK